MYIAVDFDGTIVEHKFPGIGAPVPGALEYLKQFKEDGAKLILWTMRSDGSEYGDVLQEAVDYCRENGLEFDHINENPQDWTTSNKAYAHVYIDDAAFGCPLIQPAGRRPYVNWEKVGLTVLAMINEGRS